MNKSTSWVLVVSLLLSASASADTLARTSGAFGILTYDPAPARTWEHIDTWCGGGSDNFATTDENWESGEAPDVTAGDLLAIFATGGSEALLPAGTAAAFDGIVLDGANLGGNRFEFTAGSGTTATLGPSALTVSNAPSATTWTIRWPITLRDFAQTWTIGANNTVKFDAPIGGDQDLVFAGSGTVELNAENTHSGTLKVASGTLSLVGSWVNCTNLVVAGGTFAAKNANAFGDGLRAPGEKPKLEVDVASGASLALDYDGQIDCSAFRVDGVSLRGTIGAPGSGADHEYAWISGPGLMSAKATGYNDPQGNEITNPDVLDWIEHYQADQADIDALGTNDRFDELFLLNLDLTKSCAAELRISEIRIEDGMAHVGVALSRTEDNVPVGTRKINGTLKLLGRADLATGSFEPLQPDDYDSHFETGNNVDIEYELPASNPPAFFEAVVE